MKDTWKDVPGYEGKYQADIEGRVRRVFCSGKTRLMTPYRKKMSGSQRLVIKMTVGGKSREEIVIQIVAKTFLGNPPIGYVPYHINGCQSDNYVNNISYVSRQQLGKMTGSKARRKTVAKIDGFGTVLDVYSSAREAGRKNNMSYQTVMDYCNGKRKAAFAPDGFAYAWEDENVSMRNAIRKIERENGYMLESKRVEMEW